MPIILGMEIIGASDGPDCTPEPVKPVRGLDALVVPPGMLGRDEVCRMFNISVFTWKNWAAQGKVRCGRWYPLPTGGRCKLYPVDEIQRLLEEFRGEDKTYWDPENPGQYRVPPGLVRRQDAWRMFGVDRETFERWEREGFITCGERAHRGAPKLYPLEDLNRLLEQYGRYTPPYPDPQRPGCYRVPLSGWDIRRREAVIDAESLPLVEGKRWCWTGIRGADSGYVALSLQHDHTPLHRIVLGITDRDLHVMHKNGDALDCRRENLVARTVSQQMVAARKPSTYRGRPCTSRFKGVCWAKDKGKWVAQIKFEGKNKLIGRFDDEIAAAQARDEAALAMYGEHARLNFPDGVDTWLEAQQQQATPQFPSPAPASAPSQALAA